MCARQGPGSMGAKGGGPCAVEEGGAVAELLGRVDDFAAVPLR